MFHCLDTDSWSLVETKGAIVKGRFGHTATYDSKSGVVFVYGGFYHKNPDGDLYMFHVDTKKW